MIRAFVVALLLGGCATWIDDSDTPRRPAVPYRACAAAPAEPKKPRTPEAVQLWAYALEAAHRDCAERLRRVRASIEGNGS